MKTLQDAIDFHSVYKITKNLSILYVEDDKTFRDETVEFFQDIFRSVDCANDGEQALKKYNGYFNKNDQFYDMVVTDINMPKMDGVTLIESIYKENKTQQIIVISAHDDSTVLLKLVNIGIEQFLLKPLEYNNILKTLYNSALKIVNANNLETKDNFIYLNDEYKWDSIQQTLYFKSDEIKLTKKELLLLDLFIKKNTKISTLEEIFDVLWSEDADLASKESLKSLISRLRKKIPSNVIENVYGLGYRLIY